MNPPGGDIRNRAHLIYLGSNTNHLGARFGPHFPFTFWGICPISVISTRLVHCHILIHRIIAWLNRHRYPHQNRPHVCFPFSIRAFASSFDQIKQTQIEDVCATGWRTEDVDPVGQNRQVSDLPLGHADGQVSNGEIYGDCRPLRRRADVLQIVQYLQLASRRSGMGGKKKGILRASPRQMVMALARCRRSRVDFRRIRSLCFDDTNSFSFILAGGGYCRGGGGGGGGG